jgi:hypothetical protein
MTATEYLEEDIKSMEKSILFHESRIEKYGKPHPRGHVYPFSDVDPKSLLPHLKKILTEMQIEMQTIKKKPRKSKTKKK